MAKTNDDIYELVVALDKKLDIHLAVHAERETKGLRRWQLLLAMWAAGLAFPSSAIALFVK